MSDLQAIPGEIRMTIQIKRAASGETETHELIGKVTDSQTDGTCASLVGTPHEQPQPKERPACAVAAAASDINMTGGLTIASGDTVSCSSLTYTALSA